MKTRRFLIPVIFCVGLISCEKENDPPAPVEAAFELEKQFYEAGEPILFTNCSQNAESFLWQFGNEYTTTEEHPVYTPEVGEFLGRRVLVKLLATGADGSVDSTEKIVIASKRMFRRIIIKDIDESLVPREENKNTNLLVLIGPEHEPYTTYSEYQTLPSMVLPSPPVYPIEYHHWASALPMMGNWIINLYAQVEGDKQAPLLLHSFRFDPVQQEAIQANGDKVHIFELSQEKISLEVEFEYIHPQH